MRTNLECGWKGKTFPALCSPINGLRLKMRMGLVTPSPTTSSSGPTTSCCWSASYLRWILRGTSLNCFTLPFWATFSPDRVSLFRSAKTCGPRTELLLPLWTQDPAPCFTGSHRGYCNGRTA